MPYTPPSHHASAFNCPRCGAYASQTWGAGTVQIGKEYRLVPLLTLATCAHCKHTSLWVAQQLVFPSTSTAPLPNPDLPDDIRADYEEARAILSQSPRGTAALLRLAIQKLCKHLGEDADNLNAAIGNLVKKGLRPGAQKALDIVRVIGNEAVHPGQIDLRDDVKTATALFGLVNVIADSMITQPKHIDELFESLPENKKEQIAKRDGS